MQMVHSAPRSSIGRLAPHTQGVPSDVPYAGLGALLEIEQPYVTRRKGIRGQKPQYLQKKAKGTSISGLGR